MLDIYSISDAHTHVPDCPDEASYLLSLQLSEHKALEELWQRSDEKGIRLPFFEDSRLNSAQLNVLCELIRDQQAIDGASNTLHQKLVQALAPIAKAGKGIVAFCD